MQTIVGTQSSKVRVCHACERDECEDNTQLILVGFKHFFSSRVLLFTIFDEITIFKKYLIFICFIMLLDN